MKKWMMGLMVTVLSVAASAQDAERAVLAEELMGVMRMQENIEKSFEMVKRMIPAQMEAAQKAVEGPEGTEGVTESVSQHTEQMMTLIQEELSWDTLKQEYTAVFSDLFTSEELTGMIAFYKTPAGQAFIEKQPEVGEKIMALTQQKMMQIMPKIQALNAQLMENVKPPAPLPAE